MRFQRMEYSDCQVASRELTFFRKPHLQLSLEYLVAFRCSSMLWELVMTKRQAEERPKQYIGRLKMNIGVQLAIVRVSNAAAAVCERSCYSVI